jgi:hypothetical protein
VLQVIGAGFGRTGTHSLARALKKVGHGPCYTLLDVDRNPAHIDLWTDAMDGKRIDWEALYRGYRSAVEWPTIAFLPQLLEQFPQAKVILTLRDAESWYESAAATIFPGLESSAQHPDPATGARSIMKRRLILERQFQGRYWDRRAAIEIFENHVRDVRKMVPPGRLLEYRIADGWGPLCEFLGLPEPEDEAFPRKNDRASFLDSAPEWARQIMRAKYRGSGS